MTTIATREFRIGAVMGRGFQILFRNFFPFIVLCLIITVPSFVLSLWINQAELEQTLAGQPGPLAVFAAVVLVLLLTLVATAALVYGTVQELRGQTISMSACISRGLSTMLPVLGVAVLVGVIFMIGFILLVIPGVIAYLVLWVAIPVAVIERPGAIASLRRSAQLTKGHRWQILGIVVLIQILQIVVSIVIGALVEFLLVAPGSDPSASAPLAAVDWVLQAFFTALAAVISAVGYHDLRVSKEGLDTQQIAAVFD